MLDQKLLAGDAEGVGAYLDHWARLQLAGGSCDRAAAAAAVRLAYAAAGLPSPRRIVWCGGPLQIAQRLAAVRGHDDIGANVKPLLFDAIAARVAMLAEMFWKEQLLAAAEPATDRPGGPLGDYAALKAASAALSVVATTAANAALGRLSVQMRHLVQRLGGGPRLLPHSSFADVAVTPPELQSLAVYQFLHDVRLWQEASQPLLGLWTIARHASWIVPHENICWLSEHPDLIRTDARGRLHSADGPAVRYPDGWCVYAWKGVEIPAWLIEQAQQISPSSIAATFDPALRNCMIEIMTPERFVKRAALVPVSEDETGILWRKFWSFRGVTIGSWTAVEVQNGTPEADGSRKRYFLRVPSNVRSAREGVAWTYGLTAEQYAALEVRT